MESVILINPSDTTLRNAAQLHGVRVYSVYDGRSPVLDKSLQGLLGMLAERGGDTDQLVPTVYAQRKLPWGAKRLGTSGVTIGSSGCLMCSYAAGLTDAGHPMTPDQLNDWLIANDGYLDGNLFKFAAPDKLGVFRFERIGVYPKPAPMDEIEAHVQARGLVLVMVDFDPDQDLDQHWVRYLGNGLIGDPWYGDVVHITPRYRGKSPAEAIWKVAYYQRVV